ncbi:MAG: glycosyltransferase [Bacteroidales bacterium]|nr:glycosyltransferase [Bacteroidales bacterium]
MPHEIPLWLLIVLGAALLVQLFWYGFFYLSVAFPRKPRSRAKKPPLSVIICARNEEKNLRKNIPKILDQDYPEFEVVVVDDCSEDKTEFVLREFAAQDPRFRYTRIHKDQKFTHGKKLALTVGIKSARHEHLVLTDADCSPASKHWLNGMARHFREGAEIVLGYGGFVNRKSLLNNLIRFDAMFIALQYMTMARRGIPYMGTGRNLAYIKSLFFANKGFSSHSHLASGDDDLFISQVATRHNTAVEYSPETHTRSEAKRSFRDWIRQKRRHLTTSSLYPLPVILLLGTEPLSRVAFYLSFLALMIFYPFFWPVLAVFALRLAIQIVTYYYASKHFNEKQLLLTSPFYDFLLPYLYLILTVANIVKPQPQRWS